MGWLMAGFGRVRVIGTLLGTSMPSADQWRAAPMRPCSVTPMSPLQVSLEGECWFGGLMQLELGNLIRQLKVNCRLHKHVVGNTES